MASAAWPSTCGRGTPTPRCRPTTSRPGADRAVLCRRRRAGRLGLPRQLRRRDRPAPRRGGDAGARLGTGRGAGGRRRRARGRAGQRRHRVRRRPQRTPEGGGRRGDARRALLRQPAGALAGSAAGDPARRHALPALGLARAAAGAAAVLRVPAGDGLAAGRPAADAPGAAAPARLVRHPRHRQPVLPQLRAEPGAAYGARRIPPATWC